jgi:hypothetical protein
MRESAFVVLALASALVFGGATAAFAGDTIRPLSDPSLAAIAFTTPGPVSFVIGTSATLRGVLTGGSSVATTAVEVQYSTDGEPFAPLPGGTVFTNSVGRFAVTVKPRKRTVYQAVRVDDRTAITDQLTVAPSPYLTKVTGNKSWKWRRRYWVGNLIASTYTDSPVRVTVTCERLERGKWKRRVTWKWDVNFASWKGEPRVMGLGTFVSITFRLPGRWRLRPTTPATASLAAAAGPYTYVRVK